MNLTPTHIPPWLERLGVPLGLGGLVLGLGWYFFVAGVGTEIELRPRTVGSLDPGNRAGGRTGAAASGSGEPEPTAGLQAGKPEGGSAAGGADSQAAASGAGDGHRLPIEGEGDPEDAGRGGRDFLPAASQPGGGRRLPRPGKLLREAGPTAPYREPGGPADLGRRPGRFPPHPHRRLHRHPPPLQAGPPIRFEAPRRAGVPRPAALLPLPGPGAARSLPPAARPRPPEACRRPRRPGRGA